MQKPKKKRNQTIKFWRNKCDKLFQEICRTMYEDKGCLICGGEYSCVHHYIRKSQSTLLRYNIKNAIRICGKCHFKHHSGDSTVQARVDLKLGKKRLEELLAIKKQGIGMNVGYRWYEEKYNQLKLLNPYKPE